MFPTDHGKKMTLSLLRLFARSCRYLTRGCLPIGSVSLRAVLESFASERMVVMVSSQQCRWRSEGVCTNVTENHDRLGDGCRA